VRSAGKQATSGGDGHEPIARAAHGVATIGEPSFRAEQADLATRTQRFREANTAAQGATSYSTVFAARLDHMKWFYVQWWTFLPVNTFTLWLLGVHSFSPLRRSAAGGWNASASDRWSGSGAASPSGAGSLGGFRCRARRSRRRPSGFTLFQRNGFLRHLVTIARSAEAAALLDPHHPQAGQLLELRGKRVRLHGLIRLYHEQPEIVILEASEVVPLE
jgi:hypothetical protein